MRALEADGRREEGQQRARHGQLQGTRRRRLPGARLPMRALEADGRREEGQQRARHGQLQGKRTRGIVAVI